MTTALQMTRVTPTDARWQAVMARDRKSDGRFVYAIALGWPGRALKLGRVQPAAGSSVTMLGLPQPLAWRPQSEGGSIRLPDALEDPARRPCTTAWVFRIQPAR